MRTRTRGAAALTAAALTGIALLTTSTSGVAAARQRPACTPSWSEAALPAPSGAGFPTGVAASSTHNVWFTGTPAGMPLLRWDGKTIAAAPQQLPVVENIQLNSTSTALDATGTGWMLTQSFGAGSEATTSFQLRDGRWTMTPSAVSPDPKQRGVLLWDVASLSASDAWSVGRFYKPEKGAGPGFAKPTGALIEHWDGAEWTIVDNPLDEAPGAELRAVTAISPTDIWAVGYREDGDGDIAPLTMHYDGRKWAETPAASTSAVLTAVSASDTGDVWAVGTLMGGGQVSMHWDGRTWSLVDGIADGSLADLRAVYAAAPGDVWAVGTGTNGVNQLLHGNGSTWQDATPPAMRQSGTDFHLSDITGTGPDETWVVGGYDVGDGSHRPRPLAYHRSCGGS
ncbi:MULTISPECIES: hypothetical protein [Thermomonosporaceae]|uniref:hypothetical protein n=1 Tax=Thermomonosporaceae TaxID=2012 RepID=UPI00255AE4E5|nr:MULTISPECIES: hypothetical protein [Thermomonosporaceae]MDL4774252.1 hypothetical protein [Actinomadura xylanilytica]